MVERERGRSAKGGLLSSPSARWCRRGGGLGGATIVAELARTTESLWWVGGP